MKTLKSNEGCLIVVTGKWFVILLIVAISQTLLLPSLQAASEKMEITDSGITTEVEKGLILEKGVFPNDLDVGTSQGIVSLSGSLNNILAKERAVKIAESIRGVLGVIDRTTVIPVSRPDEDIRKDVLTALLQDPATEHYQISVSVQGAIVTLTGAVGSNAEKQLAAQVAEGVRGVKDVVNGVMIDYLAKRTDSEITADIKDRIQWDIWIDGGGINPVVKNGNVILSGTVGSAISESQAFEDAWVNGVSSVDGNGLKINPEVRQIAQRKFEYTVKSDSEIKQAVQAALRLDPRVTVFFPEVTADDGSVILGGEVGNLKAKTAAGQDAMNILGVWRVDNLLKVRLKEWPSYAEMQRQLKAALAWDSLLDDSAIDVAVINRVAYLSGGVDSNFQKAEAQDAASRIKGVVEVRNHLKVEPDFFIGDYNWPYENSPPFSTSEVFGPQPCPSDLRIKKNIEHALFWSPFVHRNDITVNVDGGVATLTGTVGTWVGYEEADKDAHKGGATAVRNRLKVK